MKQLWILLLALALMVSAGCAKDATEAPGKVRGEVGKTGSSLAYEHTVGITVPGAALAARMDAVRNACTEGRFGSCSLLRFDVSIGQYPSGQIVVRTEPKGVEPLVAVASEGGSVDTRQTRAEDLAEVVADTDRRQALLGAQKSKLLEYQARKDLSFSDMLTLARELATVESQLAAAGRVAAIQQRRIETNVLTIQYSSDAHKSRWAVIGGALGDSLDSFADGISETIQMIAFGLPFVVVGFLLALLWRWFWRLATLKRDAR